MMKKKTTYKVMMFIDGDWYCYGRYLDRNRANEIAMKVREERDCCTTVDIEKPFNFDTKIRADRSVKEYLNKRG